MDSASGNGDRSEAQILLVDDDGPFLETTHRLLEAAGHRCLTAPDAHSALAILEQKEVDVVVCDILMPGNENLALVKQLSASEKKPSVVLVTAFPSVESAVEALNSQFAGYVVKPFEIEELCERIESAVCQRNERARLDRAPGRPWSAQNELRSAAVPEGIQVGSPVSMNASWPAELEVSRLCEEASLTGRESELLGYLKAGYRVSTIAKKLDISTNTVRRHLKNIFLKLEVNSQAELLEKVKPWPQL